MKWRLVIALVLWQVLIYLIADSRLLMSHDFPPRFALAFIFPSFFFIGFFLYSNRNREWLHRIPRSWPVYFQSFRIVVETLYIHALAEG
ncbi:MAG: hypothetical protein HKN79_00565, partial [Flavobacteriales bacterium]|nr:hypothetical protein [Flavobacteriales bacterium]